MLKLEDLQVDTHVAGIEASAPVNLLYIKKAGEDAKHRRERLAPEGFEREAQDVLTKAASAPKRKGSRSVGPRRRRGRGGKTLR